MRKTSIFPAVAFLLLTVSSFARDAEYAPFEIFGGYSFVRIVNWGVTAKEGCPGTIQRSPGFVLYSGAGGDEKIMNGWNLAFTDNFNPRFGIKVEASRVYPKLENYVDAGISAYSFMAGPQISKQMDEEGTRLFGHALFGLSRYIIDRKHSSSDSFNSLAMAFGGGLDWNMGSWAIRLPQVDYYPWTNFNHTLNNIRISAGIVFRLRR